MAKRGRPRKNGVQEPWMFGRMLLVLHAYNEVRSSGLKHSAAVTEVVAIVKRRWPRRRISETEVKRILAKYQPSGVPIALKVTKNNVSAKSLPSEVCRAMGIPEGSRMKNTFSFGFGPKPQYPRINSRISKKGLD